MNFKLPVNRKINTKLQQNYFGHHTTAKLQREQEVCNHRKQNERPKSYNHSEKTESPTLSAKTTENL